MNQYFRHDARVAFWSKQKQLTQHCSYPCLATEESGSPTMLLFRDQHSSSFQQSRSGRRSAGAQQVWQSKAHSCILIWSFTEHMGRRGTQSSSLLKPVGHCAPARWNARLVGNVFWHLHLNQIICLQKNTFTQEFAKGVRVRWPHAAPSVQLTTRNFLYHHPPLSLTFFFCLLMSPFSP